MTTTSSCGLRAFALAALLPVLAGCEREGRVSAELDTSAYLVTSRDSLPSPAAVRSGEPYLALDERGRLHMTWLERLPDSSNALRLAVFDGSRWGATHTVATGRDLLVNWADFPTVVPLGDGSLAAHWLRRNGTVGYHYEILVARSADGGATWSTPVVPHRDGLQAEHGFASFYRAGADSVGLIWLDGRNSARPKAEHGTMLVSTTLDRAGALGAEVVVDSLICDCCQTDLAVSARGPVVVYRDRTRGEIRDIGVVRLENGRWTEPRLVHQDGWKIAACPVNGPAIAARGDTVVVAWFTAPNDSAAVRVAFSTDAGATFGPPTRVDDGTPAGRVDVQLDGRGRALVTWVERAGEERAEVRLRAVSPDGTRSAAEIITVSSAARASGFPRTALRGDTLYAAWTNPGDSARVMVSRLVIPGGAR